MSYVMGRKLMIAGNEVILRQTQCQVDDARYGIANVTEEYPMP